MMHKIPSEKKDEILKGAHRRLEQYAAEGKGIDRYSVELKYWLEEQPEVRRAALRGRNTVTVDFTDSTQVGILLDRMTQYGGDDYESYPRNIRVARPVNRIRDLIRPDIAHIRLKPNTPETTRALLFDPLYDDWPPETTTNAIETALKNAGYTVDKMLGNNGDLPHLATIEDNRYGVIFIRSHGGVILTDGDDKIYVMVRPYFNTFPDPAASGYNGINVFYVNTNWGPRYAYAFSDEFVRHHLASTHFPNTLMHLLVCHGGDPKGTNDLIDAFRDFGVGCYTGWTRNATLAHGDPAAVEFFDYLCSAYGRTVTNAINRIETLGHSPDPSTGADLVAYGSGTLALRAFPKISVTLPARDIEFLQKFPNEFVEVVLEAPKGIRVPDTSPWGGMIAPVDRMGRRRFIPNTVASDILTTEPSLEEAIEAFIP
ncbi:MAG: hypothetical protein KKA42_09525 [candidate division Zixibacteria bacterium]|nr:hypothetical protein [candidate division Zixibacteria bacterium]